MSEPQHPTPFGSQTGSHSGNQPDGEALAGATASSGNLAGSLESIVAVGARLAQLRTAKGWSIDDVSARLKVSPQKVRGLEAGDLSHLPDRTFAAGIVRSYAKMLGADPAPFTQAMRRASGPLEQNLSLPASAGGGLPRARVSVPLNSAGRRPFVAVGRGGGDRRGDRARDVAHGRRFGRLARAPEGEREWHGGVERQRTERGIGRRDARRSGCGQHGRNGRSVPDGHARRRHATDAAPAWHQCFAGVVVGDRERAGRERCSRWRPWSCRLRSRRTLRLPRRPSPARVRMRSN